MMVANPERGETQLVIGEKTYLLRPSFASLVAAEEELGSLFALVERAGENQLRLSEIATLLWHCTQDRADLTREQLGEGVMSLGLANTTKPLRVLLKQILQGRM